MAVHELTTRGGAVVATAEQVQGTKHRLYVMDGTGRCIDWDPAVAAEVAAARSAFAELAAGKHLMTRAGPGGQPEEIADVFDPEAEVLIATRQNQGG